MTLDPILRSLANMRSGAAVLDLSSDEALEEAVQRSCIGMKPQDERLIFLHIPRTGGSAFLRCLEEWYAPGNVLDTFPQDEDRCYDVIQNLVSEWVTTTCAAVHLHVPYPIHQILEGSWSYVTWLREPVGRVVSQYRILREAAAVSRPSFMGAAPDSLIGYIEAAPHYTRNTQCKYILSLERFTTNVRSTCLDINGGSDEAIAARCYDIIKSRFSFIGISELWSLSLLAFSIRMGRREAPLMYDFMTSVDPYEPTADEIEAVSAANGADALLYAKVRDAFIKEHRELQTYLAAVGYPPFHASNASRPEFAHLPRWQRG